MAAGVDAVEEAAIVIQTLAMVGMALARQLRPTVFQQSVGRKAQEARVASMGIEDLV